MKTFEINKKNLTRLSKNIKKKLENENIHIKHNQLLNILASSFGYYDFNHFNKEQNSIEILNLSHEKSFHKSMEIIKKLKLNKNKKAESVFLENELMNTICVDIALSFELEILFPKEYFLDIRAVVNELFSLYESENSFYESNLFKEVLSYMYTYFENKETSYLFVEKLLNEIPDKHTKNLFINKLNDWSLFYIKTYFRENSNYQNMMKSQ